MISKHVCINKEMLSSFLWLCFVHSGCFPKVVCKSISALNKNERHSAYTNLHMMNVSGTQLSTCVKNSAHLVLSKNSDRHDAYSVLQKSTTSYYKGM